MLIHISGYRQEGKSTLAVLLKNFLNLFGFEAHIKEATHQMQLNSEYLEKQLNRTRLDARRVEIRTEDGYPTMWENQIEKLEMTCSKLSREAADARTETAKLQYQLNEAKAKLAGPKPCASCGGSGPRSLCVDAHCFMDGEHPCHFQWHT